jgi:hypothetical protein
MIHTLKLKWFESLISKQTILVATIFCGFEYSGEGADLDEKHEISHI